jgi:SNF2 family DNA or RNA helicase
MLQDKQEVLFTCQKHDAEKAGTHYDYRIVVDGVAHSWATFKDLPKPGESIILHKQPDHTREYSLSSHTIPTGQYGAGLQVLQYVKKGVIKNESSAKDKFVIETNGEKYLFKHVPNYGGKMWLFKNLTPIEKKASDLQIAEKSIGEEEKAIHDYTDRLKTIDNKYLRKATQHALGEERTHAQGFKDAIKDIEKSAMMIRQYQHGDTGMTAWVPENKKRPSNRWAPTGKNKYVKAKVKTTNVKKNKYLTKVAAATTEKKPEQHAQLRPHTIRALKKLQEEDGVLLDHGTGSGKTLAFLKAIESAHLKDPKAEALILAPASLTTNVASEVKKHNLKIDMNRLETLSYEKATNDSERLKKNKYNIVVADEAHRLRGIGTKRQKELRGIIEGADQRVLASATPRFNEVSDMAPLVNMVAGKQVLPEGKDDFNKRFVHHEVKNPGILARVLLGRKPGETNELKNTKELKKILNKYVDHYDRSNDASSSKDFPTVSKKVVSVEMSPQQRTLYRYAEGKLPPVTRWKLRTGMSLNKKESKELNSFSSMIRQVSNSTKEYLPSMEESTPKVVTAVNNLHSRLKKDKNFRGVVYSNFLGSGLSDYSKELNARGIKHAIYHGGLTKVEKDKIKNEYNEGKLPVMLISSSGAEGLDLHGTRLLQRLEPHWNNSKSDQIDGRAARYKSHSHLPVKDRHVDIEEYHSVFPEGFFGNRPISIDQHLHAASKNKEHLNQQVKDLMES